MDNFVRNLCKNPTPAYKSGAKEYKDSLEFTTNRIITVFNLIL